MSLRAALKNSCSIFNLHFCVCSVELHFKKRGLERRLSVQVQDSGKKVHSIALFYVTIGKIDSQVEGQTRIFHPLATHPLPPEYTVSARNLAEENDLSAVPDFSGMGLKYCFDIVRKSHFSN